MGDHTETVDIDYDPEQTDYNAMLKIFWKNHDPTSKCSRQYMSAIFYHDEEQKQMSEETMKLAQKNHSTPITTKILPGGDKFTDAENYHQKYLLQRHSFLMNALDVSPGPELNNCHVAARINGYVGGYGSTAWFDKEVEKWGINEKMADYVRKQIISSFRGSKADSYLYEAKL